MYPTPLVVLGIYQRVKQAKKLACGEFTEGRDKVNIINVLGEEKIKQKRGGAWPAPTSWLPFQPSG